MKVFARLFQKAAQSRARSPCRTPQSAKSPIVRKTQERVNSFACKGRGRTLVGGSPLFVDFVFFVGEENFLKEAFLPPHPYPSKTFKCGMYFFSLHNAFDGWTCYVRTFSLPLWGKGDRDSGGWVDFQTVFTKYVLTNFSSDTSSVSLWLDTFSHWRRLIYKFVSLCVEILFCKIPSTVSSWAESKFA